EKLLPVMLHELDRGLANDEPFLRERDEQRPPGFTLLLARIEGPRLVDVHKRDRRFGAVKLRVARGYEQDLAVAREEFDRFLVPEGAERSGQFLFADRVQCPVQREETRVA